MMREKEKEEEEEEEGIKREMVKHGIHGHPLTLVESRRRAACSGCGRPISSGDQVYMYEYRHNNLFLHEECAELPRKMRHALHPQHTLTQEWTKVYKSCSICAYTNILTNGIMYRCRSAGCKFVLHYRCVVKDAAAYDYDEDEDDRRTKITHPSHLKHELKLLRRDCSFKCDACGTTSKESSYTCTADACQYWIHERCAFLPQTIDREDHHHKLSLSFRVPPEYIRFNYKCDVCSKYFMPDYWIYHCKLCRYVVHLKCAFKKLPHYTRGKNGWIMEFPIPRNAVGEDLIGAFVRRQGVEAYTQPPIPHQDDVDYEFHHHKLTLVSSSSSSSSFQEEKEENGDDDDDEEDYSSRKSELICDGCITPIFLKQTSTSSCLGSSSSKDNYYYYMRCSMRSCKYYLHLACFHMPPQLPSLPLLHHRDHSLVLRSGDNRKPWYPQRCSVCDKETNGLYYGCTICKEFKVDIKCTSMPGTIYHAAHPNHLLDLLSKDEARSLAYFKCDAGCDSRPALNEAPYKCRSCDFMVHLKCAGLPESATSRRWDKHHPLLLTHDATVNRPGDFYCDQCEQEMNPRSWMYRCRSCDVSFHPDCLKTTCGEYRNIKIGQKYVIKEAHCHTLTYQLLTTKRKCNTCGKDKHERPGFYCALCNFFICFYCWFFDSSIKYFLRPEADVTLV
ncbi:uncharacterized protein LOC121767658 [Salvia splendens]|uniref:uncharacterized protein LOC121767658 n=1 Tax=Salvia splendens TaxID=180675 RepID=UPI001C27F360|nr:uncharacterized protein LOC121767658 [Salvia splendens]XP_042019924.1 uncharacterized protein LOC121767658 [Salvia splendens]